VSSIVVFGAGGRAGRRTVTEALVRGHQVTAVVRDPGRHTDLPGAERLTVVAGDVTEARSVADTAAGHDAAVNAAVRLDLPAAEFFPAAARALLAGLPKAGVDRLVAVGIGTVLQTSPGTAVHDSPGFPAEGRAFSLGHAAGLAVLQAEGSGLDWVVLAPPPEVLDDAGPGTGRYRTGDDRLLPAAAGSAPFSYADLAVAVLDEIDRPTHHRALVAVAG
jgi:putative NADH-flavin reductase